MEYIDINDELSNSYLDYSLNVLTDRAIPDIRDGLKPSHRRLLISMNDLNLYPNKKSVKSATIVGQCLAFYHPHSDASAYGTMVRMAQPFSLRYPLIKGQGNFGNVGGSPAAAMRYTEARMSNACEDLLDDLQVDGKWTVKVAKNFDGSRDEPTVLPSKFPNLLANGSEGIAVGWATSILPHNIKELSAALVEMVKDPNITDDNLLKLITGPDFPTGGIIHGRDGIKKLFTTGSGTLVVTGRTVIDQSGKNSTITVKDLPYGVTTNSFLEKADQAFRDGKLTGVSHLKDASSERAGDPVNVIFYLKKGEDPNTVLNQLYENTQLKTTVSGNMIALIDGPGGQRIPSKCPLPMRRLMSDWIAFRKSVVKQKSQIQLETTKKDIEKLEALHKAVDPLKIDAVIKIIKEGDDEADVISKLTKLLEINEIQAKYILDITLRKLMKLERDTLAKNLESKKATAKRLEAIINDPKEVDAIIINELQAISKKYGDERKTEIRGALKEVDPLDTIKQEDVVVTLTQSGYVKRTLLSDYRQTGRGTKGVISNVPDEDTVTKVLTTTTHDDLLIFTNGGNVHSIKVHQIPESSRTAKGRSLVNLVELGTEKVVNVLPVSNYDGALLFGTRNGLIKKTMLSEYTDINRRGITAIKLNPEDALVAVCQETGDQILFVTQNGNAVRIPTDQVSSQGRATLGKRGIKLKDNDMICAMHSITKDDTRFLSTVSRAGCGKLTPLSEYPEHNCATSGVLTSLVTDDSSKLATALVVTKDDSLLITTNYGKIVRIETKDIRVSDRRTKGVKLMNLDENHSVSNATVV